MSIMNMRVIFADPFQPVVWPKLPERSDQFMPTDAICDGHEEAEHGINWARRDRQVGNILWCLKGITMENHRLGMILDVSLFGTMFQRPKCLTWLNNQTYIKFNNMASDPPDRKVYCGHLWTRFEIWIRPIPTWHPPIIWPASAGHWACESCFCGWMNLGDKYWVKRDPVILFTSIIYIYIYTKDIYKYQ